MTVGGYKIDKKHISLKVIDKRTCTRAIVMHWTACANATALNIQSYFERQRGVVNAHYAVDWTGAVIEILPSDAIAFHCGSKSMAPQEKDEKPYTKYGRSLCIENSRRQNPNDTTIGIEMCHRDVNGKIDEVTLDASAWLAAGLLKEYGLQPTDVTTHYAIVGWKNCPRYFVNKKAEWMREISHSAAYTDFIELVSKYYNV